MLNMNRVYEDARSFTRRSLLIAFLQGAFLGVLGVRLAWLQVSQGQRYKTLAERNRINMKLLAPSRGLIVDRFGVPLALNEQNFRVVMIPEQMEDRKRVLHELKKLIELKQDHIDLALEKASKSPKFLPIEVKDNLTWEEVAKIEVNLPDLPGLAINAGELRSYPLGPAAAHIVGYVGAVSKADTDEDPVLKLPGFKVGKTAIEKHFDHELRGAAGAAEVEVNVLGRQVRELKRKESREGARIVLSIDSRLQDFAQHRLNQERSASAVVLDAHTGEVYALASGPSFNANEFTIGLSGERWEQLISNPGHPLTNKAVAGQYPPGSTFKMVTALAALEAGVINERTRFFCPGHYELGNNRFHCWKSRGHGSMNLVSALAESCDVFFYEIAREIGIDKIAETSRKLGLGSKFDFDLEEEAPGIVPDQDWKLGNIGDVWRPGETIVASIGQGYILTTPLQLAVMTARLINGGKAVKPWMAGYVGGKSLQQEEWPDLEINPKFLKLIKEGTDRVVNGAHGTARGSKIDIAGMEMGGKTGTAQVKRITMADRRAGVKNEDLPWKHRHHALFVGYAPIHDPRYVVSVVVEHGIGGSRAAAPLARDLLYEAQRLNPAKIPLHFAVKNESNAL